MIEKEHQTTGTDRLIKALQALTPVNRHIVEDMAFKLLELQRLENPDASKTPPSDLTEYVLPWANSMLTQGKSPGTIEKYHRHVADLLQQFPNPSAIMIDAYLATKSASGPHVTAHRVFAYKSFFGYLLDMDIIRTEPTQRLKPPRIPHRERPIPTSAQVAKLLDSLIATVRDHALIMLMAGSGLRIEETATLRISDIDLETLSVTVIGKGNKQRTVPMPQDTAEILVIHMAELSDRTKWLFPGKKCSKHMKSSSIEKRFQHLGWAAGIPPIEPHQLRHYFASIMLHLTDNNLKLVSRLLGHAGPHITAKVYWHLMDADAVQHVMETKNPLAQIQSARQEQFD